MSTALHSRVQKLRKQYPGPTSAVLPALRLAQEEHGGWFPPATLITETDVVRIDGVRMTGLMAQ